MEKTIKKQTKKTYLEEVAGGMSYSLVPDYKHVIATELDSLTPK